MDGMLEREIADFGAKHSPGAVSEHFAASKDAVRTQYVLVDTTRLQRNHDLPRLRAARGARRRTPGDRAARVQRRRKMLCERSMFWSTRRDSRKTALCRGFAQRAAPHPGDRATRKGSPRRKMLCERSILRRCGACWHRELEFGRSRSSIAPRRRPSSSPFASGFDAEGYDGTRLSA